MKSGRVLGVDPGEKRIGLSMSDPAGIIANPVTVINHLARKKDAMTIVELACGKDVNLIVVGLATDSEGRTSFQGRKAERLADEMRRITDIPVIMWDESNSTQIARKTRVEMGVSRNKRTGHMDELAATVILQDYLDARRKN